MLNLTLAILVLFVIGSIIIYAWNKTFRDCEKEIYRQNTRLSVNMVGTVGPAANYKSPLRPPAPGFRIHKDTYLGNSQVRNQIYKILESTSKEDYHVSRLTKGESKEQGVYLGL